MRWIDLNIESRNLSVKATAGFDIVENRRLNPGREIKIFMKNSLLKTLFALQLIIIIHHAAGAQDKAILKFADNTEKQILTEYRGGKVVSLKAVEKQAIITYGNMGKAIKFILGDLPRKAARENEKLLDNLSAVTTAYYLSQDDNKFYIAVSNSVDHRKLRDCDNCKIRCKLKLLEIRSGKGTDYLALIVSIKKI